MKKNFFWYAVLAFFGCLLWNIPAAGAENGPFQRRWSFVSESSAVIYWQLAGISQAANSCVEYGKTEDLGRRTKTTGKPRWSHLHSLKNLETGSTYYYRMVILDRESQQEQKSEILHFTTVRKKEAIRIPEQVSGPPYVLDRPGGYYILSRDVTADGTAFEITAAGVTLDLDGHTVVFGNDTREQVYGVRFANPGKGTLCNGRIVQGEKSRDYSAAIASLKRPEPTEVFGIATDVHLKCAYPMHLSNATRARIHHNHLYSRVTELESRHYPGNALLLVYIYGGDIHIHDNLLTEGCHRGIHTRILSRTVRNVEVDHNDVEHHQQYVNGYALIPCPNSDYHHNKVTSTGRGAHLNGEGILFHDNYLDTRGHMHLSDLPARTRPFKHQKIELHGIKLEGRHVKNCKVYNNFVRITQILPRDSEGRGSPEDKIDNGVYLRSTATSLAADRLVDTRQSWERDRWKNYFVKYSPGAAPAKITGNDSTTLFADFESAAAGEYAIYMKWYYVPPTPLNIACYDPNAMNEVYGNEFIGLTHYRQTRHGDYGDSGEWATAIMFISMKQGPAEPGKYSAYIHDNRFVSNDLFLNGSTPVNMTIRLENNTFTLAETPFSTDRQSRFRVVGPALEKEAASGGNVFK